MLQKQFILLQQKNQRKTTDKGKNNFKNQVQKEMLKQVQHELCVVYCEL
jgi:hypothetical protein